MARKKHEKIKMVVQSPSDEETTIWLPYAVAWEAARGIAMHTYYDVTLYGKRGTARFDNDGGGQVAWNEQSAPGSLTKFDIRTTACI